MRSDEDGHVKVHAVKRRAGREEEGHRVGCARVFAGARFFLDAFEKDSLGTALREGRA